jgi:ABC-type lipoprotein release transport system permease subunit
MQKTSKTTYIAAAVGVVALGGVLAITLGGDKETEKKAAEIKAQAEAQSKGTGMTAKEQREHMKMTAKAFAAAEEQAKVKKAADDQKKAVEDAQNARAAAPAAGPAPADAPAPKPKVTQRAKKKQLDGLDSIGSDITSALE